MAIAQSLTSQPENPVAIADNMAVARRAATPAVLAFLEAAAEDDETVEAMARGLKDSRLGRPDEFGDGAIETNPATARAGAVRALRALAARQREENGE